MSTPAAELTFEQALAELEKIVDRMESGELSLEQALPTHNRGLERARVLPGAQIAPPRLHAAMRYAALGGGKRVRPLLAFAAGEVTAAAAERVEIAAAAVELIHA